MIKMKNSDGAKVHHFLFFTPNRKREEHGKGQVSKGKEKISEDMVSKHAKEQWVPKKPVMVIPENSPRQKEPLFNSDNTVVEPEDRWHDNVVNDTRLSLLNAGLDVTPKTNPNSRVEDEHVVEDKNINNTLDPSMDQTPGLSTAANKETVILKRPSNGVTADTRQALLSAGLVSVLSSSNENQKLQQQYSTVGEVKSMQPLESPNTETHIQADESVAFILKDNDPIQEDLRRLATLALQDEMGVRLKGGERLCTEVARDSEHAPMGLQFQNKFSLITTEDKLQRAFENLHNPTTRNIQSSRQPSVTTKNSMLQQESDMELSVKEYLSDGTGTKYQSNRGVPFTNSAPTTDVEQDRNTALGTRTKKNKRIPGGIRRSTRVIKGKVPFTP